ncbi:MAG: hypothetical protein AAFO69_01435, partial [Bacteroidota bacterium]
MQRPKRIVAIFLLATFVNSLIPYQLLASGSGPEAPEAFGFEPVDATDMVNLLTGDFSYVLPLLDVPSPEGGYPMALSYHAGVAMDQAATWTGLGWNINPGAVNRSVSGVPDDWKRTRQYSLIYDKGGVKTSYSASIGIGVGGLMMGRYFSFSQSKAFGGETSHSFHHGVSVSTKIKGTPLGVSAKLGTDGVEVGAKLTTHKSEFTKSSIGLKVKQSFLDGSTKGSLSFDGS